MTGDTGIVEQKDRDNSVILDSPTIEQYEILYSLVKEKQHEMNKEFVSFHHLLKMYTTAQYGLTQISV